MDQEQVLYHQMEAELVAEFDGDPTNPLGPDTLDTGSEIVKTIARLQVLVAWHILRVPFMELDVHYTPVKRWIDQLNSQLRLIAYESVLMYRKMQSRGYATPIKQISGTPSATSPQ